MLGYGAFLLVTLTNEVDILFIRHYTQFYVKNGHAKFIWEKGVFRFICVVVATAKATPHTGHTAKNFIQQVLHRMNCNFLYY